jgi:hypothetical protein
VIDDEEVDGAFLCFETEADVIAVVAAALQKDFVVHLDI